MELNEYFFKALRANAWRWRIWIFSCFTVSKLEGDDWRSDPFPYRLVVENDRYYFVDPERELQLTELAPYSKEYPLFAIEEPVDAPAGTLPNLTEDTLTTYGNLLFNSAALCYPFGATVPYYNKPGGPDDIESLYNFRAIENLPEGEPIPEGKVTQQQIKTHINVMYNVISHLGPICVQSTSERMLRVDPEIIALRDRLLAENKDRLNDITVVADIIKQLVQALRDSYKDDPAAGFLFKNKHFDTILLRTRVMHGVEHSFDGDGTFALITKSLAEGWDFDYFAELNNSTRMGSFNRGANTAMGGEAVKFFYRRFQNSRLHLRDCGSKATVPRYIDPVIKNRFVGNWYVEAGELKEITKDNLGALVGKTLQLRDPAGCKEENGDCCIYCIGENYRKFPTALANIEAVVPSTWMYIYMKKMHGEALKTTKFNTKLLMD